MRVETSRKHPESGAPNVSKLQGNTLNSFRPIFNDQTTIKNLLSRMFCGKTRCEKTFKTQKKSFVAGIQLLRCVTSSAWKIPRYDAWQIMSDWVGEMMRKLIENHESFSHEIYRGSCTLITLFLESSLGSWRFTFHG
jgi:hypothetical protein